MTNDEIIGITQALYLDWICKHKLGIEDVGIRDFVTKLLRYKVSKGRLGRSEAVEVFKAETQESTKVESRWKKFLGI